ncbi:hypothetical protein F511_26285 [Dorcoceras hygrometricum]|uniref:Uncharacterized protein n=1 Tax=Dorcoceras hygrometricum TaxID=472368 RepID=A0A2Z7ANC2_9LAMI|nr:hypothetical protein F511_26285 [Dorcoceras hygrometricum]
MEKMDSTVEVFSNDDVITISNVNKELVSARMTSAFLLEEAVISNDDVIIADWKKLIQRREVADEDRTVMMTSAVMSSQSAVDKKRKS